MISRGENAKIQAALAIWRDNALCVFCLFRDGVETNFDEVHHFFGRGKDANDPREHYTSLVCTCRKCHPQPIRTKRISPEYFELVEILKWVNECPINKNFKHEKERPGC